MLIRWGLRSAVSTFNLLYSSFDKTYHKQMKSPNIVVNTQITMPNIPRAIQSWAIGPRDTPTAKATKMATVGNDKGKSWYLRDHEFRTTTYPKLWK